MSMINITLSKASQEFVAEQVVKLGLAAPEEYIEKLIEEELWAYYEKEVAKAFESGPPIPAEEFWKQISERRERRRQERKAKVV